MAVVVGWATVTVAPVNGKPLNCAAGPLFPLAPVVLKA